MCFKNCSCVQCFFSVVSWAAGWVSWCVSNARSQFLLTNLTTFSARCFVEMDVGKPCAVTCVLFLTCMLFLAALRFAEDGMWLPWTTWTTCSATCGGGQQQRERGCNGVLHGGKNCTGSSFQSRTCNTLECPGTGAGWTLGCVLFQRRDVVQTSEFVLTSLCKGV